MESFATQLGSAACKIGTARSASRSWSLHALTVLALGTTFVVSHIHLAAAAPAMKAAVSTGGRAENCYLDNKIEVTAAGKRIVRRVVECD